MLPYTDQMASFSCVKVTYAHAGVECHVSLSVYVLAEVGIAQNEPVALPEGRHQGAVHPLKLSATMGGPLLQGALECGRSSKELCQHKQMRD